MCWQATQTYPCDVLTPRQARRFVAQQFAAALGTDLGIARVRDAAEIVTSELVTNTCKAESKRARLTVAFHRAKVRLAVADDAPGEPRRRNPAPTDESGRGLHIVTALASDWGVEQVRGGKQVWAELELPTSATRMLACRYRDA
jgi:anti-sigma regulatory factor (Ser/Thr protein kinase)